MQTPGESFPMELIRYWIGFRDEVLQHEKRLKVLKTQLMEEEEEPVVLTHEKLMEKIEAQLQDEDEENIEDGYENIRNTSSVYERSAFFERPPKWGGNGTYVIRNLWIQQGWIRDEGQMLHPDADLETPSHEAWNIMKYIGHERKRETSPTYTPPSYQTKYDIGMEDRDDVRESLPLEARIYARIENNSGAVIPDPKVDLEIGSRDALSTDALEMLRNELDLGVKVPPVDEGFIGNPHDYVIAGRVRRVKALQNWDGIYHGLNKQLMYWTACAAELKAREAADMEPQIKDNLVKARIQNLPKIGSEAPTASRGFDAAHIGDEILFGSYVRDNLYEGPVDEPVDDDGDNPDRQDHDQTRDFDHESSTDKTKPRSQTERSTTE